jgi:putative tryptophan/tyrosine transport system substrate-binding protein
MVAPHEPTSEACEPTCSPIRVRPGALPTVFSLREFPAAGGLMSYGLSIADAAFSTARALHVAGDAFFNTRKEQFIVQVELVINLQTAKTLGLSIPLPLLGRVDEVIE